MTNICTGNGFLVGSFLLQFFIHINVSQNKVALIDTALLFMGPLFSHIFYLRHLFTPFKFSLLKRINFNQESEFNNLFTPHKVNTTK